jgi:hypothetical protein
VEVGERVSRVELSFGDDAALRPIGGGVAWGRCKIVVPEIDVELTPIDLLEAEPLLLTTCTRVWDEQIFKIRSILQAPCEATVVLDGAELPVEPAWSIEMLVEHYPALQGCTINGHTPAPGWLVQDYGVVPGAVVQAEKKPG